ncbi:MAG TPA: ABC transporter substrate-binding protein [Acidimicrobiales bacterium]
MLSHARPRWRGAVGLLMVAGLLLGACSSDSDSSNGSTDTTVAGGGANGDIDPTGVVNVGYDLVAGQRKGFTFDPVKNAASSVDEGLYYAVYGRLMRPTQDGELVPDLAETATVVDAGAIEIVLRDGATWQDGTPFTATDVKVGLERSDASNNTAAYTAPFFELTSVDVVSETTAKLNIANGTAASWFDSFMGKWQVTIVKPDTNFDKPVGAGPMQVTAFTPQTSMSLEKWDGYWDAESILPGGIELTNVVSEQVPSGIAAVKSGQIDFVLANVEALPDITAPAAANYQPDNSRLTMLMMCKSDGALSDPNIRIAINKAIDREAINEAVFAGTNEPANQPWPENSQFYDPSLADVLSFDLEAAKQLVADSDYAAGFEFNAYTLQSAGMPDAAAIMKQQLEEIGATMNIVPAPNYVSDFLDPPRPGVGVVPAIPAGRSRLNQWTGDQISNTCDYNNPQLNDLITDLSKVSDSDPQAVELWNQISDIVVNEALSGFILFGQNMIAYNEDKLAEATNFPATNITFPDLRRTSVKADS